MVCLGIPKYHSYLSTYPSLNSSSFLYALFSDFGGFVVGKEVTYALGRAE